MKLAWMAFVLVCAMIGTALAADDPVAWSYDNTIIGKYPNGNETKTMFKADKTYTGVNPAGQAIKGTWALKDGKLCLYQSQPPAAEECLPVWEGHKVGDTWESAEPEGKVIWKLVSGQ
jgi:hypothetical protein